MTSSRRPPCRGGAGASRRRTGPETRSTSERVGCQGRPMPTIRFDEDIAATYDEESADRFDPQLLALTTEFLAQQAGDGRALELAIGTGRVAVPLSGRGVDVAGI